jgi:hypothetical protein
MESLVRRIEILESCVAKQRGAVARSIDDVVSLFHGQAKAGQMELLISAFGGERTGRALTAAEAEVKAQFLEVAKHEFQRRRISLPTTVSPEIVIYLAAMHGMLDSRNQHRVDFYLYCHGLEAVGEGREPSREERAAMDTYTLIWAHLAQLAGFSAKELDECRDRVWEAEA